MFGFVRNDVYDPQEIPELVLNEDGSNASLFYVPVDPITQQSFCINFGGYIRNDVSLLVEMQDSAIAADLLQRLQDRGEVSYSESDVSDFELIQGLKAQRCQTASEMIEYYDSMLEIRDLRLAQENQKKEQEKAEAEFRRLRDAVLDSMTSEEKDYYLKKKREKEIDSVIDS